LIEGSKMYATVGQIVVVREQLRQVRIHLLNLANELDALTYSLASISNTIYMSSENLESTSVESKSGTANSENSYSVDNNGNIQT
jgi:hypothetical protein